MPCAVYFPWVDNNFQTKQTYLPIKTSKLLLRGFVNLYESTRRRCCRKQLHMHWFMSKNTGSCWDINMSRKHNYLNNCSLSIRVVNYCHCFIGARSTGNLPFLVVCNKQLYNKSFKDEHNTPVWDFLPIKSNKSVDEKFRMSSFVTIIYILASGSRLKLSLVKILNT